MTAIVLRKGRQAVHLCYAGMRRSSRPPPHGREHAWLETGGNPDARGTDLPKSRASGSRTPATGLPRPPIRLRHTLSYTAHPEATQVAGGACLMRARSWAVREAWTVRGT